MLKIAWDKVYNHPLPEGHRFPMIKYDLIPEQLLYEGTIREVNLFIPSLPDEAIILNTHDFNYWSKLKNLSLSEKEIRKTGFPLSKELVEREIIIMNGTVQCALFALQYGISMNIAGGTHHAFRARGEGFCLLNDLAIAANYLLMNKLSKKILIIDLDVHQGNGTAEIFQEQPSVFTFSMHGGNNYPSQKESSDLDIPLPDRTDDLHFLSILKETLPRLIHEVKPDFIFYQSGVDILGTDKLGKLSVSREGCKERDRFVLTTCKRNKIPLTICMGGGYSEKIQDVLEAHCNTFRLAQEMYF
jgi:acetoin utilization deacetylase AcuC-like enzyme